MFTVFVSFSPRAEGAGIVMSRAGIGKLSIVGQTLTTPCARAADSGRDLAAKFYDAHRILHEILRWYMFFHAKTQQFLTKIFF